MGGMEVGGGCLLGDDLSPLLLTRPLRVSGGGINSYGLDGGARLDLDAVAGTERRVDGLRPPVDLVVAPWW